tara:strand:+ start:797 stop:1183 length:387 start_codon:yes stop_codon:yes gene_type:complete
METELDARLKQVIQTIESMQPAEQASVLKQLSQQSSEPIVDINKAKSSIGSTPIGSTGLTPDILNAISPFAEKSLKMKDDSVLRRLGTEDGLMGFYDKALQSRKNDRLLQGGGLVADMIQRMALINKL